MTQKHDTKRLEQYKKAAAKQRLLRGDAINKRRRDNYDPDKMRLQRYGFKPDYPPPKRCEACQIPFAISKKHMDHNHETNAFRGWLCGNCNRALGYAGDSRLRLIMLADYLALKEMMS